MKSVIFQTALRRYLHVHYSYFVDEFLFIWWSRTMCMKCLYYLYCNSWLWTSKFFVNKCLSFTTYNKRENIYWKYSAWFVHVFKRRIRHRTVILAKLLDPCNQYEYLLCSNNRLMLAELVLSIGPQVVICGIGGELCLFVRGSW
jgi:hypothetical protein